MIHSNNSDFVIASNLVATYPVRERDDAALYSPLFVHYFDMLRTPLNHLLEND